MITPPDTGVYPVVDAQATRRRWTTVLAYTLAGWLCLAVLYASVLYVQSAGAMGAMLSLRVALENGVVPTVAAWATWWLTERYPWPDRRLAMFAAVHLSLAAVFAITWSTWTVLAFGGGASRMSRAALLRTVVPWHLMIGLLLYGLIAGTSYAARGALRLGDLRLAAERADRLRVEAELAALRAHIDPHFLFNTLHSVSELLRVDQDAAQDAIERLADLFRYTLRLDRHDLALVSLEDEWKFTESYLWLERLRMGTRLCVQSYADDEALACRVPPFILQPLVENAIRHGLGPRPSGGTLRVWAQEEDGRLLIDVQDDGVGTTAALLEAGNGLGLNSVRQRLHSRYGATAALSIDAGRDGGVAIRVDLPAELA